MDIQKEWGARPPKKMPKTLADLVTDFIDRFPRERRDTVLTFCQEANTLNTAIIRAITSKDANGRHHNHQSKIKREVYMAYIKRAIDNRPMIAKCNTFDQLHDLLVNIQPEGAGPVMAYDVATRIAAFMKLEPESVYVHAGVAPGAKALALPVVNGRIARKELPRALMRLTADECEDFLCTYRHILGEYKE
jgi:hypothetical protein